MNFSIKQYKSHIILFILLFGLVGGYVILASRAAQEPLATNVTCTDGLLNNPSFPAGYETARIPNTLQPAPANVNAQIKIYVSKFCGDDLNSGLTQLTAKKTVAKAIAATKTNGTTSSTFAIFIDSGVYRENLGDIDRSITLQPQPGKTVWISGSDQHISWTKMSGRTVWQKSIQLSNNQLCQGCSPAEAIGSDPNDNVITLQDNSAMVFIGGVPLKQVATLDQVIAGTFSVVRTSPYLVTDATTPHTYSYYIGDDPTGKNVEITTRISAGRIRANNVTIRGIGIRNFGSNYNFCKSCTAATRPAQAAQLVITGGISGFTLHESFVGFSASDGLNFAGDSTKTHNHILTKNRITNNGHRGVSGNLINGLTINNNRFDANNRERFRYVASSYATAAGLKITTSKNIRFDSNIVENNFANGFWCDIGCFDVDITRNSFRANARNGIHYEISAKGNIVSNTIVGSQDRGISIGGSGDPDDVNKGVQIYNNTIIGSQTSALYVYQINAAERSNTSRCNNFNSVVCITGNVNVVNNYFTNIGYTNSQRPMVIIDGNYLTPAEIVRTVNNNLYYEASGTCTNVRKLMSWKSSTNTKTACTIGEIRTITVSKEANGLQAASSVQGAITSDYKLASGNIGIGMGALIPAVLTSTYSWLPTSAPNIGIVH
ncbi:MAG: right-handed parallel beta-helix repeat-containing protein [Patescibacteria group bacterium]